MKVGFVMMILLQTIATIKVTKLDPWLAICVGLQAITVSA